MTETVGKEERTGEKTVSVISNLVLVAILLILDFPFRLWLCFGTPSSSIFLWKQKL